MLRSNVADTIGIRGKKISRDFFEKKKSAKFLRGNIEEYAGSSGISMEYGGIHVLEYSLFFFLLAL
jgi:hypothetical protein